MLLLSFNVASPVFAQTTAFMQTVALVAGKDKDIAAFYKARDYKPIWTGYGDGARRRAFLEAATRAADHGLPVGRYDAAELRRAFNTLHSSGDLGRLEVETTRKFLQYARDIHSGILEPNALGRKDFNIKPPRPDRLKLLREFALAEPRAFLKSLPPQHPDYARLLKEKARLEKIIADGGWGPEVHAKKLKLGSSGPEVAAFRLRLAAMGYKRLGISQEFNEVLEEAVKLFQIDQGLNSDGVAGGATLAALNASPQTRLKQVIIGLERQRWINRPRGKRHIFVNQADFRAFVMDNGKVTLETRVVVGKSPSRYRTPEFSDSMTHLVINPTWHVPESIALAEYLPMLRKDPNALRRQGIQISDLDGNPIDPRRINFARVDEAEFPFHLSQPPGRGNALGRVKFMFPNKFNIYLHDTPSRHLFARDRRAYSHGCVRVHKPLELAYTLLARQSDNPKRLFHRYLNMGEEVRVNLREPIPVHLVYHTAWVTPDGRPNYRLDTYGRDKRVFKALTRAGVVLQALQG